VLEIVSEWVRVCNDSHESCAVRQAGSLPTRLISTRGDTVRLEITQDWQFTPPYATLSYCWGNLDFIKTSKSNLEEFLVEIPHHRLPRTFKDAIQVIQALNVDYIWIDSLCIIQDSDVDWRKESSRMSEVYGNSYLNIAASSATDPGQGCFLKPQGMRDALSTEVTISGQKYRCDVYNPWYSYSSAVEKSHLLTRAWALQEKLLPTRTLHLGHRGAYWECRSGVGLECLPTLTTSGIEGVDLATLIGGLTESDEGYVSYSWERVGWAYSTANLTVSRDKLPGLAGIAEHFGKYKRCEYLAGMWQDETFDAQLCWCIFEPRPRPTWRAPTWSWISVDGNASFHAYEPTGLRMPRLVCARTLEASVTRVSEAEFGEVSDGRIRITCSYILCCKMGEISEQPTLEFRLDNMPCHRVSTRLDCTDNIDVQDCGLIYVLPLIATSVDFVQSAIPTEHEDIRGLVLQQTGRASGEFRRIGFFRCGTSIYGNDDGVVHLSAEGRAGWNQFIGLIQEEGTVTAKDVCAEVIDDTEHGTGGFVITVV
jgi:hypothetical protein